MDTLIPTEAGTEAPRIGVPVPTSANPEYNTRAWPQYAAAVASAGGVGVEIPLGGAPGARRALAETCAGYLLPGSPADVDPAHYGQERDPATSAADPARESCDIALLEHAEATGKPVLAICYGLQHMNVWRGGSLLQDLDPIPVNHQAGSSVAVAHSVRVARTTLLASLLTATEAPAQGEFRRLPVNSSHHQAVANPGDDLAIVARASEDGVVEAVEGQVGRSVMIGVQWHPERDCDRSAASRALFAWLVSAAADSGRQAGENAIGNAL